MPVGLRTNKNKNNNTTNNSTAADAGGYTLVASSQQQQQQQQQDDPSSSSAAAAAPAAARADASSYGAVLQRDDDHDSNHRNRAASIEPAEMEADNDPTSNNTNIANPDDGGAEDDESSSLLLISMDDAIERLGASSSSSSSAGGAGGGGLFQFTILTAAGLAFAADGMQVVLLSFLTLVLKEEWALTNAQAESLTSVLFLGAMVGTLLLGPLADVEGRRPVFLGSALTIGVAGLATAAAPNYACLLTALFAVGTGVGGLTVPFDILAEFLPAQQRGTQLLKIEYFWTAGCLYVVLLAYLLLNTNDSNETPSWRTFVALCALPCWISLIVGYLCVPESPRWLASQGRCAEALDILRQAAVVNHKYNNHNISSSSSSSRRVVSPQEEDQFHHDDNDEDIFHSVFPANLHLREEPEEPHASIADLLAPKWRFITLRLWGAWFFFAFGYFGTILATTRVFASDGNNKDQDGDDESSSSSSSSSSEDFDYSAIFISSMAEIVGTTLVIAVVDRLGRVPSQIGSYTCAGVLLCLLCVLAGEDQTASSQRRMLLIGLGFGARAFEMAGTCVTWVATAELLTTEVRGTGHSTANAIARIGSFLSPFLVEGNAPLFKVGVVMLVVHAATVLCVFQLPETKGRALGFVSEDDTVGNEQDSNGVLNGADHDDNHEQNLSGTVHIQHLMLDGGGEDDDDDDDGEVDVHRGELS